MTRGRQRRATPDPPATPAPGLLEWCGGGFGGLMQSLGLEDLGVKMASTGETEKRSEEIEPKSP